MFSTFAFLLDLLPSPFPAINFSVSVGTPPPLSTPSLSTPHPTRSALTPVWEKQCCTLLMNGGECRDVKEKEVVGCCFVKQNQSSIPRLIGTVASPGLHPLRLSFIQSKLLILFVQILANLVWIRGEAFFLEIRDP